MSAGVAHVFHVGIRKSGTTTLQSYLFPRLDGWAYLGRGAPEFARLHRILKDLVGREKGRVLDDDWSPDALTELLEAAGRGSRGVVLSRASTSPTATGTGGRPAASTRSARTRGS